MKFIYLNSFMMFLSHGRRLWTKIMEIIEEDLYIVFMWKIKINYLHY